MKIRQIINSIFTFLFCWGSFTTSGQAISLVANLDSTLSENSGITLIENKIILHNDGGNPRNLYLSDTGTINFQPCLIDSAINVDWEDITHDDSFVYIGDFGNNNNHRQDLTIYKIPKQDVLDCSINSVEKIYFSYPDQYHFPALDSNQKFDAEALVSYNDSLYIFTKDRTQPFQGKTWVYSLPKTAGTYVATQKDSISLGTPSFFFSITGASISPDQSKLALINANTIFLFSDFSSHSFFDGSTQIIPLETTQQYEAIGFSNDNTLYFSCEKSFLGAPQLFKLTLSTAQSIELTSNDVKILITPDTIELINQLGENNELDFQIINSIGQFIQKQKVIISPQSKSIIDLIELPSGVYFLHVFTGTKSYEKAFLKR